MKRTRLAAGMLMATVLIAPLVTTTPAQAGWPKVFDHIPAESHMVICTNSLNEITRHYNELGAAIEFPMMQMMGPQQLLMMNGVNPQVINGNESWAIVKVGIENPENMSDFLVFIPVTDYAGFVGGFVNEPVDGLDHLAMPSDDSVWSRSIEGFAVMSDNENVVRNYTPDPNSLARWQKVAGRYGEEILARGDVAMIVDFKNAGPAIKEMLSEIDTHPRWDEFGAEMDKEQIEKMVAFFEQIDLETAAVGLRFSGDGVAFDIAFQGGPEGLLGQFLPGTKNPTNALTRLPDDPFFYAASCDMRAVNMPAIMDFMKTSIAEAKEQGKIPANMPFSMDDLMEKGMNFSDAAEGYAIAVYPSLTGMMNPGLLMNSAAVYTGNTETLRASFEEMMSGFSFEVEEGFDMTVDYQEGAAEVDGTKVDQFSINVNLPAEQFAVQMQMNQMFGPQGIRGYVIPGDNGIAITFSREKGLVSKVLATMNGERGLAANKGVRSLESLFWTNQSAAVYIGMGTIAEQVAPMAVMMLGLPQIDVEALGALPPIGIQCDVDSGAIIYTMAVPAPVIKATLNIAMQIQMQQMQPDFDQDMGDEDEEEDLF